MTVAGELPGGVGGPLVEAARAAYTSGLVVTAAVGAVVLLGLAVVAALAFRSVPPYAPVGAEPAQPEESAPTATRH